MQMRSGRGVRPVAVLALLTGIAVRVNDRAHADPAAAPPKGAIVGRVTARWAPLADATVEVWRIGDAV